MMLQKEEINVVSAKLEYVLEQYKNAENIGILENLVIIFNAKLQEIINSKQINTYQLKDILDYEGQLYNKALDRITRG